MGDKYKVGDGCWVEQRKGFVGDFRRTQLGLFLKANLEVSASLRPKRRLKEMVKLELPEGIDKCTNCGSNLKVWIDLMLGEIYEIEPCEKCGYQKVVELPIKLKGETIFDELIEEMEERQK